MKNKISAFILLVCMAFSTLAGKSQSPGKVAVAPNLILKNMDSFWDYNSKHLKLNGDFVAYDTKGHLISKDLFFRDLITAEYLPLQVYSKNDQWEYQLYKLKANTNRDIKVMLKQIGVTYYGCYKSEGKPFPNFHYVDLNGNTYTPENTRGKILVLKGWYIGCGPCVAEMPMLNKLKAKYKNRKDIMFVSIAPDPLTKLKPFMANIKFDYAIAHADGKFFSDTLHVVGYPVHWIINKKGIVTKMTYDHDVMIAALKEEASKKL